MSPTFIWAPVYSFNHWPKPRTPPPPSAFGLIYEGAVGQPRQTTSLCKPMAIAHQDPNPAGQRLYRFMVFDSKSKRIYC